MSHALLHLSGIRDFFVNDCIKTRQPLLHWRKCYIFNAKVAGVGETFVHLKFSVVWYHSIH